MQKYSVERCVGNTVEVLGIYETKEEMLKALEAEKKERDARCGHRYKRQTG